MAYRRLQADHIKPRLRILRLLLASVPICVAQTATAQTTATTNPTTPDTQQATTAAPAPKDGGDIVVTANRRSETTTKLPFNISAYDPAQFERSNITSVTALSSQVPNFVIQNQGARAESQSVPIIRGLNASGNTGVAPRYSQSPVGFYQDNAPLASSLPLMDLARVEVLRGPQGTLYGAGTLSGAVRLITNPAKIGKSEGYVTASVADVSHSGDTGYGFEGAINLPIGDTLAVRIVGKHQYDAGYIDLHDIYRREGNNYLSGNPILENPSDVAGSKGVFFNKKDANYSKTTAVRGAAHWKPSDRFDLQLSYSYAKLKGQGGPIDNAGYEGGASPLDPRVQLGATGDYERSAPTLEPYDRTTQLAAVDATYELGFATLATTLAFGRTHGRAESDGTVPLIGSLYGVYYTGSPANPRAVVPVFNEDRDRSNTQEVRLVSNTGGAIDYVVGTFFQQEKRTIGLSVYDPGADTYTAAANGGSTLPIVEGGTYVPLFANGQAFQQNTTQRFHEYSLFGDVTWHITDAWSATGGARVFHQTFDQNLTYQGSIFGLAIDADSSSKVTSQIFKANTSYKLSPSDQVYATFSQGFRRGGSNAFPLDGPVQEPRAILAYSPDRTNNYEVGVKGRVRGIRYAVDAFYIDWKNPQIDLVTPYTLAAVVVNARRANSKGVEAEASGPLGLKGLTFTLGAAYAKARLSEAFGLPAGDGAGGIVQNAITGSKGDRLPGAPDYSGSLTLSYERPVANGSLTFSAGADYRSSTVSGLPDPNRTELVSKSPGYVLFRGSIGYDLGGWQLLAYGDNLADKRAVTTRIGRTAISQELLGNWGNSYFVTKPREIGLKLTRKW